MTEQCFYVWMVPFEFGICQFNGRRVFSQATKKMHNRLNRVSTHLSQITPNFVFICYLKNPLHEGNTNRRVWAQQLSSPSQISSCFLLENFDLKNQRYLVSPRCLFIVLNVICRTCVWNLEEKNYFNLCMSILLTGLNSIIAINKSI